jgi:hypothetical protein
MTQADAARLRTIAWVWVAIAGAAIILELTQHTKIGLTGADGRPLGDDFINYWSGAYLTLHRHAADVYNWPVYHALLESVAGGTVSPNFNYSYPPVLLILTVPFGLLPYVPAFALWQITGWFAFYRALAGATKQHALLPSLATPAVFVNAYGGQNGAWSAAFMGGALVLLDRMPIASGALFGLLIYKPHLGLLIPVALIAGRRWRTLAATAATAAALILVSIALFGWSIWADYLHFAQMLRVAVLEDGTGIWHRMVSVFVFTLRLTSSVPIAYAVQAASALIAAAVVAIAWYRDAPAPLRNSALMLGTMLATPYLQDYDLVMSAFVAVWLYGAANHEGKSRTMLAIALLLVLPCVAGSVGKLTGFSIGPLLIVPAFWQTARMLRLSPSRAG